MYKSSAETSERLTQLIASQRGVVRAYREANGSLSSLSPAEVSDVLGPNFKFWASTLIRRRHFQQHSLEVAMSPVAEQTAYDRILRSLGYVAETSTQTQEDPIGAVPISTIVSANVVFIHRVAEDAPQENFVVQPAVEVA